MDFVCAKQFHSNVNKVSPNRTILAGEKVGITWLLLNEPGVYWSGVFLFLLLFFSPSNAFPRFSVAMIAAGLSMLTIAFHVMLNLLS